MCISVGSVQTSVGVTFASILLSDDQCIANPEFYSMSQSASCSDFNVKIKCRGGYRLNEY